MTEEVNDMLKQVQIDTLHMVAKLSTEQMGELYDNIDFKKDFGVDYKKYRHGKVFKHIIHCTNPFYIVFIEPKKGTGLWASNHYDILVHMQKEAIQQKPALLKTIFGIGEWRVKRLDIAFDWSIPITQHFMWKNGNVRKDTYKDNENYYLYGERNESRAVLYDKKLQMKLKKGIDLPDEHLTRLEVRIRPKLKSQSANVNDLDWIKKHLNKFVFVENTIKLSRSLKDQDKKAFRALRRNANMDWLAYGGDSVKRRIRQKAKEQSVNLFDLFVAHGADKDIIWKAKTPISL